MLAYWETRSQQTTNPLLIARYTGLLWDFTNQVTGNKPNFAFAVENVEALLCIAAENLHEYEVDTIQKLKRALHLATSLNNTSLIERARDAILDYEMRVAEDDKAGLWGFSFDVLIENKKVKLSEPLEASIIQELEDRLSRLKDGAPFICEHAVERLAKYYRSKNLQSEVERVILILGNAFEVTAGDSTPLHALSLLERVHKIYVQFGLRDGAERVAKTMRAVGPRVRDEMQSFTHQMEVSHEEFDEYIEHFLKGDMSRSFELVAVRYIPRVGDVQRQLDELARAAPLASMFTRQLLTSSQITQVT